MEKAKQASGSSSSITMDDLFGPGISSKSSSSSTILFGSIFGPPPPAVYGKNSSHSAIISSSGKKDLESEQGTSDYMAMGEFKKDRNSVEENGTNIEPCYFNSSIYYGGQEVYSPTSQKNIVELGPIFLTLTEPPEEIGGRDLYITKVFPLLLQDYKTNIFNL